MTVVIFFGVEEGAGTAAATFGGRDVAGGAMEGGGADGVVAIEATADPEAPGAEALGLGEIRAVFGGS